MENPIHEVIESLISKGIGNAKWVDIDSIKQDPNNPRKISKKEFAKLKQEIADFPEMMALRPGVVDAGGILKGGNQRHRAAKANGWHKFPIVYASELTEEQLKRFTIKDNMSSGEWDMGKLKEWDNALLADWGLEMSGKNSVIPAEISFAEELDQMNNFVVLKFTSDVDWLNAQTTLGLEKQYGTRQNGKPWNKGLGRVIDGNKALKLIKESIQGKPAEKTKGKGTTKKAATK